MSSSGGAVVTGAGRGLGRLIAGLLIDRGHEVLVTDLDEAAAVAVAVGARSACERPRTRRTRRGGRRCGL